MIVLECLRVQNLEKYYGNKSQMTKALENIEFSVEEGEFVGIMGPSGSGKSTLLNCIATLERPTSGTVCLNGEAIDYRKERKLEKIRKEHLGFIFQEYNLLSTLTAYENIALSLTIQNQSPSTIQKRISLLAQQLGIQEILGKYPAELSGGQQQRVAAARALVKNPDLILADEPTGALDSKSAYQLLEQLEVLQQENQATILMVTHDAFTASFAQRILFIKDGKIFSEIEKGNDTREQFFQRILEVIAVIGGGEDVF